MVTVEEGADADADADAAEEEERELALSFGEIASRTAERPVGVDLSIRPNVAYARSYRRAIEQWATARGFSVADGVIATLPEDGVVVTAPLFAMTENLAVVSCVANTPAAVTLSVETTDPSWVHDLFARFGSELRRTGDPPFDDRFTVRTSDERVMPEILNDGVRASLLAMHANGAWCKVTYAEGRIELRLDTPHLAGVHLLGAIAVVAGMTRARVQTSAYR